MTEPVIQVRTIRVPIETLLPDRAVSTIERINLQHASVWISPVWFVYSEGSENVFEANEIAKVLREKGIETITLPRVEEKHLAAIFLDRLIVFILKDVFLPVVLGVISNYIYDKWRDRQNHIQLICNVKYNELAIWMPA